ncbi:flagellar hook protein FlgE [Pelosinus sp. UFO1]|uniref:flagellar hook protein FlgE n=1 Tax=Pelosinus sp. UFO1 TaxID=484770 RepID=UPI0004D11DCC|nr:flagellar hook-basal body complex protein [Pelosinus sp. UFO1]AIF53448.1 flagellar hook-basal body protein [Pelosinus sp. UFO1]
MAMMVALGSAVSGLKSEQTALDVIANNIANVNTTAYKSQTVSFSDVLSQTISSATASTATTGGTNAQQVGLGVQIASTDTDMTVGSTSATSNATDVALTGDGYFIVSTGTDGEYEFSRAGNMTVDDSGNLNINGYEVCGWETSYTLDEDGNKVFNTNSTVEPINLYSGNNKLMAAEATTSVTFSTGSSLDSTSDVVTGATLQDIGSTAITDWDATTSVDVVDAQGNTTEVTLNWKKCATDGSTTSWYWEASGTDATISPSSGYVAFDADGKMVTSVTPLTATVDTATNTAGYSDSNISVSTGLTAGSYTVTVADSTTTSGQYDITLVDADGNTTTTTSKDGSATFTTSSGTVTLAAPTTVTTGTSTFTVAAGTTLTFDSTPAITVKSTAANTDAVSVEMDFSNITTTSNTSATLTADADGYASGTLSSYSISSDGIITGTYSNNQTQAIAQIALAVFDNASGLTKTGDNLYTTSSSSGDYKTVVAGTNGTGTMTSYALELSNVDLSAQFSAMMIAQRAYQANSKVVSTADDMLQALMAMKN